MCRVIDRCPWRRTLDVLPSGKAAQLANGSGKRTSWERVCCRRTRIRRLHDLISRERAAQSMREGPSRSTFRSRSQTTSKLLWSRAMVVSVGGKARENSCRYASERRTKVNLLGRVVKKSSVVETRCVTLIWDKLAGGLMTERVATGVEEA